MIPFFFILFSSFRRRCLLTKRQIKSFALRFKNNTNTYFLQTPLKVVIFVDSTVQPIADINLAPYHDINFVGHELPNILFQSEYSWLQTFLASFPFEVMLLLFILFFVLIKTTVIDKTKNNDYSIVAIHTYTPTLLFIYLTCNLILAIIYYFTEDFTSFVDITSILNSLKTIFPVGFYTSSTLLIFHITLTGFFIFFIYFVLDYCSRLKINPNELILLLILFLVFIRLLFSSYDLFTMYLSLEGLTYIIYILILLCTDKNIEVVQHEHKNIFIKYFIYNGVSSLAILFSISSLFAFTGNLKFSYLIGSLKYLSSAHSAAQVFFILIIFCLGFFFKLLVFPLFYWAHDFYENLPTFLFILMNTFYKVAIFCIFIKVLIKASFFFGTGLGYSILLYFGFFTFISGILGALFSSKIRPFLFYTSINQIGLLFIALGQLSYPPQTGLILSVFYYFFIYMFSLFFFLIVLYSGWVNYPVNKPVEYFKDLQNLSTTNPFISIALSVFLFSFAGIPPFMGFFAKYELLMHIFNVGSFIGIFCIIGSIFSAFYYISLITIMYFNKLDISNFLTSRAFDGKKQSLIIIQKLDFNKFSSLSIMCCCFIIFLLTFNFILPELTAAFKDFLFLFILA